MAGMSPEPLILFPGMACDERLFGPQRACGLHFESPRLPAPREDEDLASYAARVAVELALGDRPCTLGGVSLGGMLACELARRCNCRRLILVASCRGRQAIPVRNWPIFWCARLLPDSTISRLIGPSVRLMARMESFGEEHRQLLVDMCRSTPIPVLRRQAAMILSWKGPSTFPCPVVQIHGVRDRMIPFRRIHADQAIADGGHMINLTHPVEVTHFIARHAM